MAGPDVRQCRDCGKLFQYYGNAYCSECLDKMDDYYTKVRDYLYDHPAADMAKVTAETEVDSKYITQFLREGRLQFSHVAGSGLKCAHCGTAIGGGMYCDTCKIEMAQKLQGKLPAKPKEGPSQRSASSAKTQKMHVDLRRNQ